MRDYLIMDGRASYDVDSASIMEAFSEETDTQAILYAKEHWVGYDFCIARCSKDESPLTQDDVFYWASVDGDE